MFLFPLGLHGTAKRFPVATFVIVLVTVLYSILRMNSSPAWFKHLVNNPAAEQLTRARTQLLVAACEKTELTASDCDFLKEHVKETASFQPVKFQKALIAKVKKRAEVTKGASHKFRLMLSLALTDMYWEEHARKFKAHAELLTYQKAKSDFDETRSELNRRFHLLSQANLNWRTLIEAQLTHGGWAHLIGNMTVLVVMAIAVEERIGALWFLATYILGGLLGLSAHVLLSDDPHQTLIGASANVSAAIGLFLVLFWKSKMRIWLSAMFVWNRQVLIPTRIFIPVFLVSYDVIGTMASEDDVAHLAHLGGFCFGALAGWLIQRQMPLAEGCLFPFEQESLERAKTLQGDERLAVLHEILVHNEENVLAQDLAVQTVSEVPNVPYSNLSPMSKGMLRLYFSRTFNRKIESDSAKFLTFLRSLPAEWPIDRLISRVDLVRLQAVEREAEAHGRPVEAIRLLQILRRWLKSEQDLRQIDSRIRDLEQKTTQLDVVHDS